MDLFHLGLPLVNQIITEELYLIGYLLDDLDLVTYALNVLGRAFHEFTLSTCTFDSPITFHELYDMLVDNIQVQCYQPLSVVSNIVMDQTPLVVAHMHKISTWVTTRIRQL